MTPPLHDPQSTPALINRGWRKQKSGALGPAGDLCAHPGSLWPPARMSPHSLLSFKQGGWGGVGWCPPDRRSLLLLGLLGGAAVEVLLNTGGPSEAG